MCLCKLLTKKLLRCLKDQLEPVSCPKAAPAEAFKKHSTPGMAFIFAIPGVLGERGDKQKSHPFLLMRAAKALMSAV